MNAIPRERRVRRPGPVRLLGPLAILATAPGALAAQGGGGTIGAPGAAVFLRIAPRLGDTLFTRVDQLVEMTGTQHVGTGDSSMTFKNSMVLLSHVVVQEQSSAGTTVLAVTDSVALGSFGPHTMVPPEAARQALQGKSVRMLITPEGSATALSAPDQQSGTDLQWVMSAMPATLSRTPVAVGATWTQVTTIPIAGDADPRGAAVLHATFHLDSLSREGGYAFISMKGQLTRDSSAAPMPSGFILSSSGSVSGNMVMDRRRGWWVDSRVTITVHSKITPPPGVAGTPMRVLMHITQRMRTLERLVAKGH